MKKLVRTLAVAIVIIGLLFVAFLVRFPPDPLVYCQKQHDAALEQWKLTANTNAYPNVNGQGFESARQIGAYIKAGDEVMKAYGYVPGLADNDPPDLVLMYLKQKTRRTWNGDHSATVFREKKWMVIGPDFWSHGVSGDDLPEGGWLEDNEGFKRRLQKTLAFLKEKDRPYWQAVIKEHSAFLESIQE